MSNPSTPDQMIWKHDGYTFVLDEDGVSLRLHRNAYEQDEVLALIDHFQAICTMAAASLFSAPRPPSREEVREQHAEHIERRAKQDAIRAIRDSIDSDLPNIAF